MVGALRISSLTFGHVTKEEASLSFLQNTTQFHSEGCYIHHQVKVTVRYLKKKNSYKNKVQMK